MLPTPPARLHINLNAIADNWRVLAARHPGKTAGVVKANAYGLGAAQVVPALHAAGCRHFFTAHLSEALAIRPLIADSQLMVLHGILPGEAEIFSHHAITPILSSLPEIALWQAHAQQLGRPLAAFLQADTGMSRLGLSESEITTLQQQPERLSGLTITHVMTHLYNAEIPSHPANAQQLARILAFQAHFPQARLSLANSSGMFLCPAYFGALTRPGAALYGINPTPGLPNPMQNVVRLEARILAIRTIPPGTEVGYNGIWTAQRPSRIATLATGYADGYMRCLGNPPTPVPVRAFFDGHPAPLVGRVSMDLTTFDITDLPPLTIGDHLELIGPHCPPDDLALAAGTNGYEILTNLGQRYQRLYTGAVSHA